MPSTGGGSITPPPRETPGDRAQGDPEPWEETESLGMLDGTWVIADGTRFWLHQPDFLGSLAFSRHLLAPGSARHTRQLLAGALTAGSRSRLRDRRPSGGRARSLQSYIHQLAASYQTTRATPETMRFAATRLRASGDVRMADHCLQVADEEAGHDRLALKDLEALGIRAAEFVEDVRPANALALVELFKGYARSSTPVSVVGYAYALERGALFNTGQTIAAIEALVPPGVMATRCLRVHSAEGTDARHVLESIDVIAGLCEEQRAAVATAVFETAACMAAPSDYPGDGAFGDLLSRYRS